MLFSSYNIHTHFFFLSFFYYYSLFNIISSTFSPSFCSSETFLTTTKKKFLFLLQRFYLLIFILEFKRYRKDRFLLNYLIMNNSITNISCLFGFGKLFALYNQIYMKEVKEKKNDDYDDERRTKKKYENKFFCEKVT